MLYIRQFYINLLLFSKFYKIYRHHFACLLELLFTILKLYNLCDGKSTRVETFSSLFFELFYGKAIYLFSLIMYNDGVLYTRRWEYFLLLDSLKVFLC